MLYPGSKRKKNAASFASFVLFLFLSTSSFFMCVDATRVSPQCCVEVLQDLVFCGSGC